MSNRIESYKAGHWQKDKGYQYFVPEKINQPLTWTDNSLNELLEKASIKLGELNSFARLVPNIDLFIQLHVTKEAVLSSRIEGTQTNMGEALMPIEELIPEKRNDWQEVANYTRAMNTAIAKLKTLPLSSRLLKETHEILLSNDRGKHKMPGEFRKSQNWIGGASLADASFIPPQHEMVNGLMGDLENFLHNRELHIPSLIRIGIAHYQFETIHPFLDGNGRIGRLLITLFLVSENILEQPLLYLSAFFEKNKKHYYDNLTNVRDKNDLMQWIKFFLVGIEQTATQGVNTLSRVMELKMDIEKEIIEKIGRRSRTANILLNNLFRQPVMTIKDVTEICNLTKKSAGSLVNEFEKNGWLREQTGQSRNRIFMFQEYLNLFS